MRALFGLLVVAACGGGGGGNPPPDGPTTPDGPDAAGVVHVTVAKGLMPRAGVRVYFQNADSSLVATTTTDASGVTSATLAAGGFVTVVDPFEDPPVGDIHLRVLRTFAGVKPGDQLVLRTRDDTPVSFTLKLPTDPNGARYFLFSPCSAFLDVTNEKGAGGVSGPGGPVQLFGCAGTTSLLTLVVNASNQAIKALYKPNVTLANGATIDVTADTYSATHDTTWRYESVPQRYPAVRVQSLLVDARGPVLQTFANAVGSVAAPATPPTPTAVVPGSLQIDLSSFLGPAHVTQHVLEWGPATTDHTTVLGSLETPTILVPDYTSEPVFDIAGHTLGWTVDTASGARQPDLAVAEMTFDRTSASQFWSWRITAAGPSPSVAFPVLPGDDAILNPVAGDGSRVFSLFTARVAGGYDAVRANVLSFENPFAYVTGASGQVVLAEFTRLNAAR